MPTKWTGTAAERIARLRKAGRDCDANSGHCTRAAVEVYDVFRADGNFNRLPDAEREQKKCCSYHRLQFLENGQWVVVANRQLIQKDPSAPRNFDLRQPKKQ